MTDILTLTPIGRARCTRTKPEDDRWDAEETSIALDPDVLDPRASLT